MADSGYTYGVRQGLASKGIADNDINYDPNSGYVQVKGQNFLRPQKNYSGTTFTNQSDFNNAWQNYAKNQNNQPAAVTATTVQQPTQQTSPTNNPYDQKYSDMLGALMQQAQHPTTVDVNSIYSSPQWAAIQAQQQRAAQQGIRAVSESMGASGFGRSTALGERAQGIQNQANEYMQTQALPQLIAQEQQRQQQQYQNQLGMLNQLAGQQGVYDTRYNNANNLAINKAGVTGYYEDPQAEAVKQLIAINSGKWASATPEEQGSLHDENLRLAASIGGRDTTGQGDYAFAPQRTVQGEQLDLNKKIDERNFQYQTVQDAIKNGMSQQQIDNQAKQFADRLGYDYENMNKDDKRAWAQIAISQHNANTSSNRASSSSTKAAGKAAKEAESGGPKVSTNEFNNAYKTLQEKYGMAKYKETGKDSKGNPIYDESAPPSYMNTTNPDQQAKLVVDVLNLGLNDDQTLQMWNKLGITEDLARELLGG